jgi:putative aldouronate transport system substrate-binding protein
MKARKSALTLAVSLSLVLAAACSSGGVNTPSSTPTPSSTSNTNKASENKSTDSKKSDMSKKYKVTMMDFQWSTIPPKDSRGIKMINEKFNVDYQNDLTVYSEYAQKLATVISSGNIPDVTGFETLDSNYYKWAEQGVFLPLDDYINDYPSLKSVAPDIWAPMKKNGKIYAIPKYFPATYLNGIIIRQDWLDNLGLKMPTSYEELKQVAIAFTKNDPDKNGKNDTYGLVLGGKNTINPSYSLGAYWEPGTWYSKDKDGNFLPGYITDGWKSNIQLLHDLYKEGAVTKDFALLNTTQYNGEFYAGKGGIFLGSPRGMVEDYMASLLKVNPGAKFAAVPPFKAPDGTQGYTAGSGYYNAIAISAKLKDQPDKVRRILEMVDYGRKFFQLNERSSKSADFDWMYGNEGTGYKVENGRVITSKVEEGLAPFFYMPDNKMWAPKDELNEYSKTYSIPQMQDLTANLEKVQRDYKHYVNPIYQASSTVYFQKATDLFNKLIDTNTKMITGDIPISDWDKMVQDFMKNGGADMIKDVNDGIKKAGYQPTWK